MVSRQVVKAQSLCFQEEGVFNVVKMVFLPWYNSYRFLMQNIARIEVCRRVCRHCPVCDGRRWREGVLCRKRHRSCQPTTWWCTAT